MRAWLRTVGVVVAWQITASLGFYGVFATTQFLPATFAVPSTFVGFAVTALMLGYTVGLFPAGALVDGYGERPLLVAGLAGLSVGALALATVASYAALLVVLFVLGCVYAVAMPATNRAVVLTVPVERRSFAMSLKQVGVTGGSAAGAVLVTTFATTRFGWQGGFLVVAALGAGVTTSVALGYSGERATGTLRPPRIAALVRDRRYVALVVAGVFLGAAMFTTLGYTTPYVNESVGLSPSFAGVALVAVQLAGSAGRIVAGGLADRLDTGPARANAIVLLAQAALAAILLVAVTFARTRLQVLGGFALLGFTILGFTGVYYACLGELVPNDRIGAATAGGQVALNAGALFAPPAFGVVAERLSYDAGWWLLAACLLLGLLALSVLVVLPSVSRPDER